ncbi:hypothetical protein [Yersinia sp. 2545 StPb PI]
MNTQEADQAYEKVVEEFALLDQLTELRGNVGLTRDNATVSMGVSNRVIS